MCLNSRDVTYIFIGLLHLVLIGFKLKCNMISKHVAHLDSPLLGSPVLVGIYGGESPVSPASTLGIQLIYLLGNFT